MFYSAVVVVEFSSARVSASEATGYVSLVLTKSISSTVTSSVMISTSDGEAIGKTHPTLPTIMK